MSPNGLQRRPSVVLPPKRLQRPGKMSTDPEEGPVLPPKDPRRKTRGTTINLPGYMWDELDRIAELSGEYSRNEVIQLFLENRIAAWHKEQSAKKTPKK